MAKLSEDEISGALTKLDGWRLENGQLSLDRGFANFAEAMRFVNAVAAAAEAQDHHPDIDVRYNKVRLVLYSHDLGGITRRDLRLAGTIAALGES